MKWNIHVYAGVISAILLLACLFGCSKGDSGSAKEVETQRNIKIGAVLPMTGSASVLGDFVVAGVKVAEAEINANGGVRGKQIQVVYGDSKNDAKEGITVYRKLKDVDGVKVMLSSMSGVSSALVPLADSDQTVLFATTVSSAAFPAKSPWVFRLFITADIDAAAAAQFARQQLNATQAGIVYVEDDFGKSFSSVFQSTFEAAKGKVVFKEGFPPTSLDFKNLGAKLAGQKLDVIYLLGYDKNLGIVLKHIQEAGIRVPIISIATVGQPYVLEQAGAAAEGVYFTSTAFDADNPVNAASKAFIERFLKSTGKKPNYFSAFAYDSLRAICMAMECADKPNDPDAIRKTLSSMPPFEGTVGKISFDQTRDASFPMIIMQIRNGHPVKVQDK